MLFLLITLSGLFIVQGVIFSALLFIIHPYSLEVSEGLAKLGIAFATSTLVETNFAKAGATAGSMLWNYTLYKRFVFQGTERISRTV
jgi:hypothetical protein